jgi:hypothetical protein
MIDFMFATLGAVLLVFCTLFIISFVTLGMITGLIHLVAAAYRSLFISQSNPYPEPTAWPRASA